MRDDPALRAPREHRLPPCVEASQRLHDVGAFAGQDLAQPIRMRPNAAAAVSGVPKCGLEHWDERDVERLCRQVEIGDVCGGRVQPADEIKDSGGLLSVCGSCDPPSSQRWTTAGLPAQVLT